MANRDKLYHNSEADIKDASEFGDNNSNLGGSQLNVLQPYAAAHLVD